MSLTRSRLVPGDPQPVDDVPLAADRLGNGDSPGPIVTATASCQDSS